METVNVTAIILAAGQSKRFGEINKLFARYKNRPLIDHCLDLVADCNFTDRIIVTGFELERVENHTQQRSIRPVYNSQFETGMASSLIAGVQAIKSDCDAFMVFLADMPDVAVEDVRKIIHTFIDSKASIAIVRPTYNGIPGHPVLFATSLIPELQKLSGDQGAVDLIKKYNSSTRFVEVVTEAIVRDVDRFSDLK